LRAKGADLQKDVDKERAQAFAHESCNWLAQRNIPPTPGNFEIAYNFVGGDEPELKLAVESLIAKGCKFEPSVMNVLHERYFPSNKNEEAMSELSGKVAAELDTILHLLETAGKDHSTYGNTLSQASGQLGHAKLGEGAIKTLIDGVVGATRAMEARSKTLELQLQTSSREVNDLRDRLESVKKESLTDQLTGISNRKAFDVEMQQSIAHAVETGEPLSVIMCDIDRFKVFNDTWGHQTGDQVLRLVANCLSENVKGRDTAARYGGEEFVVILPQTTLASAVNLANQIRGKVESKKLVKKSTGDILGVITISAGVAEYEGQESPADFLRRADACLYAAKRSGRNCVISEKDSAVKFDRTDTAAA
jgi:diguanylate cyclase